MGGATELRGPDLMRGVAESDLPASGILLGHAEGEPVILVRVGTDVHAAAATCSHYGGPLAEGLVVGETVRCPWHHACFNLRTGEPVRAPALNDVAIWNVERKNGRIRVTGKAAPVITRRPRVSPASIGIVGAGAAGAVAAETLRREGYAGPLTLFDAEPDSPYDRPNLSKDYLAGTAPEEWIPLHAAEFYEARGIDVVRAEVVALDAAARTIGLAEGSRRTFESVLLAPGAEPVRLNVAADGARVFYLRSLGDSRAIIRQAESARRVAIIGASFIGLEVAASLRHRGLEVEVVAPEDVPLARIMGDSLGRFVRALHEERGVRFHLGRTARAFHARGITLDNGVEVAADLIVIGIGVRPRLSLAQAAGLTIDNGIVVNEFLETSAPGIWAAGDAARWPDPHSGERIRVEHWVVAERMGQTAARNMLGAREPFDAVPFFWSQHYDATIAYVGHTARFDEAILDGDPAARDCAVELKLAGRRLAVATIFRDTLSLETELAMERRAAH